MGNSLRDLLMNVKAAGRVHYVQNKDSNKSQRKTVNPPPYPHNVNSLVKDGVDHINISQNATTDLGLSLNPEIAIDFLHPVFGEFNSLTGFWYYIKSKERDNKCRKLIGKALRVFTDTLTLDEVKNFRAIILEAMWIKINQHDAIKEEVINSTLPFDCYFIDIHTKTRRRPKFFSWFLRGMNDIRNALKEGKTPDFSKYFDVPGSEMYQFVDDHLTKGSVTEVQPEEVEEVKEVIDETAPVAEDTAPIGYDQTETQAA